MVALKADVAIVMGSESDLQVMSAAKIVLDELEISNFVSIVSAHRTPARLYEFAATAVDNGLKVIIAGAGGAAHLPGMIAAISPLPVIGVPVSATKLAGRDALLSIVQMPAGVPVATVAIDGARNAGILAAQILGASDPEILRRVSRMKEALAAASEAAAQRLEESDK
jgi:5-(carboxyamino)imidazole ribonucleotide mutase